VNDDDADFLAVLDAAEMPRLALVIDVARVAAMAVDAAQHLHQGGFAGAVFPDDGVDLAAAHPQVDIVERNDAREGLAYRAHFQDRVRHITSLAGQAGPCVPLASYFTCASV
jgi:hypothetical protein